MGIRTGLESVENWIFCNKHEDTQLSTQKNPWTWRCKLVGWNIIIYIYINIWTHDPQWWVYQMLVFQPMVGSGDHPRDVHDKIQHQQRSWWILDTCQKKKQLWIFLAGWCIFYHWWQKIKVQQYLSKVDQLCSVFFHRTNLVWVNEPETNACFKPELLLCSRVPQGDPTNEIEDSFRSGCLFCKDFTVFQTGSKTGIPTWIGAWFLSSWQVES